uniref:Uncharacterized protein n=1 Tax=Timema cristinae TaxID=61476 RepID=A0A7R9H936_TIMCR|nr:unnamed protein product [Timema cristinae]
MFGSIKKDLLFLCCQYQLHYNKMERDTFAVKIEPEDLEYNLHHEEEFGIKSEIDLPIKSEEYIKVEALDYQEPECWTDSIILPPVEEERPSEIIDLPIKSELCFKGDANDYQVTGCCPGSSTLPPIKEELPVSKLFIT